MRKGAEDLNGRTFGFLKVIERAENSRTGLTRWRCQCTLCGEEVIAFATGLKRGRSKTCVKCAKKRRGTHGLSRDRIYPVWQAIIRRCENPESEHFKDYGGRGISVCEEWHDVSAFAKWAYENGFDPKAKTGACTIERRDVNGDYCPENCYWADMKVQSRNKRSNRMLTIDGESRPITELAENAGLIETTVSKRISLGWSVEDALKTPVDRRRGGHRKPVVCLDDGSVYRSLADAAAKYGISYDKLRRAVDTDKEIGGHKFFTAKEGFENDGNKER